MISPWLALHLNRVVDNAQEKKYLSPTLCVFFHSMRALIFVVVQSPSYRRLSENSPTIRNSSLLVPLRLLLSYARCRSPMCCASLSLVCMLFLRVALLLVLRLQSVGVCCWFSSNLANVFYTRTHNAHSQHTKHAVLHMVLYMRIHRSFKFR